MNISFKYNLNNRFNKSIIINFIILIITGIFFGFLYETNDDIFMSMISEGNAENDHLIYINIFYGKILKILNNIFPALNWYGIMMYLLTFIGMTILTYIILINVNSKLNIYVAIVFSSVFGIDIFHRMQFTKVSVILMFSGIMLIKLGIEVKKINISIIASILFIIGSMIRFSGIYIVIVFTALIIVSEICYIYLKENRFILDKSNNIVKFSIVCICLGVCALSFKIIDNRIYNSDIQWREYKEYNEARTSVQDYPIANYEQYKKEYNNIGIKEIDLKMLMLWLNSDTEKFNYNTLKDIASIEREKSDIVNILKSCIYRCIHFPLFNNIGGILFLLIIFYIFLFEKKKVIYILASIIGVGILYFILMYQGRIVYRVEYGIWICAFITAINSLNTRCKKNINYKLALTITLAIVLLLNIKTYQRMEKLKINDKRDNLNEIIRVVSNNDNNLYFYSIQILMDDLECISPFEKLDLQLTDNLISLGGWYVKSKIINETYSKYDIDNTIRALVDKDNSYLVDNRDIELIYEYIKENYYENIDYKLEGTIGDCNLYKFYLKY